MRGCPFVNPEHGRRVKSRGPPVRVAITWVVLGTRSIKDVCRVIGQSVEIQEPEIFSGIRPFTMMGLLVADVVPESLVVETGNAERTVSMLPLEVFPVWKSLMNPPGRIGLDRADQLGDGYRTWRLDVQVYMVPNSTGAKELAALTGDYLTSARKESRPPLRIQPGPAILGGPYEMQPQREVDVGHTRSG